MRSGTVIHLGRRGLVTWTPAPAGADAVRPLLHGNNQLSAIPPALCELPRLRHLDLRHNNISAWPAGLAPAGQLGNLGLRCNPAGETPPVIEQQARRGCLVHA